MLPLPIFCVPNDRKQQQVSENFWKLQLDLDIANEVIRACNLALASFHEYRGERRQQIIPVLVDFMKGNNAGVIKDAPLGVQLEYLKQAASLAVAKLVSNQEQIDAQLTEIARNAVDSFSDGQLSLLLLGSTEEGFDQIRKKIAAPFLQTDLAAEVVTASLGASDLGFPLDMIDHMYNAAFVHFTLQPLRTQ